MSGNEQYGYGGRRNIWTRLGSSGQVYFGVTKLGLIQAGIQRFMLLENVAHQSSTMQTVWNHDTNVALARCFGVV